MDKKTLLILFILIGIGPASAIQIGQNVELFQYSRNARINFTSGQNFTFLGVRSGRSTLGNSNFTALPENSLEVDMDFYRPGSGRQDFVTNFTASYSSTQTVGFNLSDLPSSDFYEAFETGTGNRIKIGYTDPQGNFNFTFSFSTVDITVFNYGEKGVEVNEVTFNTTDPVEGNPVKVSVNLSNEGVVDPETPNVTLETGTYESSWTGGSFYDENFTVPEDGFTVANFTWEAKPGPWNFEITSDPQEEIKETNEDNNRNSTIVNVDSYHVFYGGTDLKLELGAGSANVKTWKPDVSNGNIFLADRDSSFLFSDLSGVGDGNYTVLDDRLNVTGHNDSISEVWDPDGDGKAEKSKDFEIAGENLTVPVANSTSDGTWKTGILYDTADGEPYNGTQDLVFVTEIKDSKEGKFGIYNYEIRVPFSLGQLDSGVDRAQIYTEID